MEKKQQHPKADQRPVSKKKRCVGFSCIEKKRGQGDNLQVLALGIKIGFSTPVLKLGKYKEVVVDIHSLFADVQSLSTTLYRKVKECENLSVRSTEQVAEINKLQAMVQDLKDSDVELKLKLIWDIYRHEFTDLRDKARHSDVFLKSKNEENEG
ncbi:uncharacterized protein LOC120182856 isoform X2 [Hibiscus syriacus]|uniref:uncharacterized protein LOC120182856 isoform X2 n=1 Tax=Hibiscus syriacus TaxID=106335 RepID=UPI0019206415|nr:uncharacterized protein LOC120182856 isoform X2 [Hibiscus syriacus]